MDELSQLSTEVVFNQHDHFIIIGLTGRCGSGCSTTCSFLTGEDHIKPRELLQEKRSSDSKDNDYRDLSVLVNYAERKKIFPLTVLKVRDILTSFIVKDLEAFFEIIKKQYPSRSNIDDEIYRNMKNCFPNDDFQTICKRCSEVWDRLDKDLYRFLDKITLDEYDLIFNKTHEISEAIRKYLNSISSDAYTVIYQHIGNIVRTYGLIPIDITIVEKSGKNFHCVVKRINSFLKLLRRKEWILQNNKAIPIFMNDVRVVIDSIKNLFEAHYLRSRYRSFFLLAITLEDDVRQKRKIDQKGLNREQIKMIDLREQPSRAKIEYRKKSSMYFKSLSDNPYNELMIDAYQKSMYAFNLQDVDSCVQNADIMINNGKNRDALKCAILRYVCLMMHPGLVVPTKDERCMQVAQAAKVNSGCLSRQVGAVVCDKNNNILSVGWNDPATSNRRECVSCIRRDFLNLYEKSDVYAYSDYELNDPDYREYLNNIIVKLLEKKGVCINLDQRANREFLINQLKMYYSNNLDGLPYLYCFKDIYCSLIDERNQVHTRAQHGEEKAFEGCAKSDTEGGTLFTTSSSCELCAKKAISYGVRRIVYIEPYNGITNTHVLGEKMRMSISLNKNEYPRKIGTQIKQITIELFTGATQSAYVQLYTPIFPLKDEIELRGLDWTDKQKQRT